MIDLGISKMALIGAVALIVIGPEKLPRVARTVGTLLGKAQRYVADVKAEVNRSMELDELRKMKETVEVAARDVESSIKTTASDFEKQWEEATSTAQAALAAPPASGCRGLQLNFCGRYFATRAAPDRALVRTPLRALYHCGMAPCFRRHFFFGCLYSG